jgi:hypothetical protein
MARAGDSDLIEDELRVWECEYERAPKPEGYYDLIELPNGKHIPVPIAKRLVGEKIVESIPISKKVRDGKFFYCIQCDEAQQRIDELLKCQGVPPNPSPSGHSFFRCRIHKPTTKMEVDAKEAMMLRLILGGLYRCLKYVPAQEWHEA